MTDKELREIRRRFRPDKSSILRIKGCIVNGEKNIISHFNQPMAVCSAEESEKLLGIMKKSISGGIGTNLTDIEFSARQAMEDDRHKLLMCLKNSALKDENALAAFYERVIAGVNIEGNFAILLAFDNYDVFSYTADGEKSDSQSVFSYMVCCVCPVKPLDVGLSFREYDNTFKAVSEQAVLSAPVLGFMFPAFDDRASNIYGAVYYNKDVSDIHPQFVENIFGVEPPQSAAQQKDSFKACLKDTLDEECSFEVVRSVHNQISEMEKEHKETRQEQPLKLSKAHLKGVLEYCGVEDEKIESFADSFDEQFGKNANIAPKALVDTKKFELTTPDVSIKVNPERTDLVSTQVIGGVKYIMIRANDGVELNGLSIDIS